MSRKTIKLIFCWRPRWCERSILATDGQTLIGEAVAEMESGSGAWLKPGNSAAIYGISETMAGMPANSDAKARLDPLKHFHAPCACVCAHAIMRTLHVCARTKTSAVLARTHTHTRTYMHMHMHTHPLGARERHDDLASM